MNIDAIAQPECPKGIPEAISAGEGHYLGYLQSLHDESREWRRRIARHLTGSTRQSSTILREKLKDPTFRRSAGVQSERERSVLTVDLLAIEGGIRRCGLERVAPGDAFARGGDIVLERLLAQCVYLPQPLVTSVGEVMTAVLALDRAPRFATSSERERRPFVALVFGLSGLLNSRIPMDYAATAAEREGHSEVANSYYPKGKDPGSDARIRALESFADNYWLGMLAYAARLRIGHDALAGALDAERHPDEEQRTRAGMAAIEDIGKLVGQADGIREDLERRRHQACLQRLDLLRDTLTELHSAVDEVRQDGEEIDGSPLAVACDRLGPATAASRLNPAVAEGCLERLEGIVERLRASLERKRALITEFEAVGNVIAPTTEQRLTAAWRERDTVNAEIADALGAIAAVDIHGMHETIQERPEDASEPQADAAAEKIARLEAKLAGKDAVIEQKREENRALEKRNEGLSRELERRGERPESVAASAQHGGYCPAPRAVGRALRDRLPGLRPIEVVRLIAAMYGPQRLVVPEKAQESEFKMDGGATTEKLARVLCELAGPVLDDVRSGTPLKEAGKKHSAPRLISGESTTTLNNPRWRAEREVWFEGSKHLIVKHIPLSKADRIYFEVIEGGSREPGIDCRRILIGYVGNHPPNAGDPT